MKRRTPSKRTGRSARDARAPGHEDRALAIARRHPSCRKIYQAVAQVPRGRVATYGQVAAAAGFPRGARLAGWSLHHTPPELKIPWHRVINAAGRISFPPRSAPYREQRRRLEAEGVVFIGGRVSLARYGWQRRSDSPLLDKTDAQKKGRQSRPFDSTETVTRSLPAPPPACTSCRLPLRRRRCRTAGR